MATITAGTIATSDVTLYWPGVVTNEDTLADSGSGSSGEFAYTSPTGLHWVKIDLGATYTVDKLKIWHYAADGRRYHQVKAQVSANGTTWTTVFDSDVSGEYQEMEAGRVHSFAAQSVRYVREYLNGNTVNSGNHWIEIEVWGTRTTQFVGNYYEWNTQAGTGTSYYYAGQTRVAMRRNGAVTYIIGDHLGSTQTTVNGSGVKVSELRYKAYGETRYSGPPTGTPTNYRFTGQQQSAALGLYHMGARWYDPYLGRWLSADTLVPDPANPQSFNRYSYTGNNPVKYVDPTGHAEDTGSEGSTCAADDEDCIDVSDLWDQFCLQWVGDPAAAEQAFLHFLSDPEYFIALYADATAWNASEEAAYFEVFLGYSVLHTTPGVFLETLLPPDVATDLYTTRLHSGTGDESEEIELLGAGLGSVGLLLQAAEAAYPKLAGKSPQWHHYIPMYLGGARAGLQYKIPAPYHQWITSEFRQLWPYGQGKIPNAADLEVIVERVYSEYPIPPNSQRR